MPDLGHMVQAAVPDLVRSEIEAMMERAIETKAAAR